MAERLNYKILFTTLVFCSCVFGTHPELGLSFEERIQKHGYPIEVHKVYTEDDYILSLYRIPHGVQKSEKESTNKSIVLIAHGMGGSPANFIVIGKGKAVIYYLADRDFDVWVFCARGNHGSFEKKHKKWDWNEDNEYWLYSMHEIGVYDLTATIDYVLNKTAQQKLFLIGHSAGGNEIMTMLSERPDYNNKVKMVVNWACSPVLRRTDYPLAVFFSQLLNFWKGLFKYLGTTEMLPQFRGFRATIKAMCADPEWKKVCIAGSWIIGSRESVLQHPDDIELIVEEIPRVSNQQVFHFMEVFNAGEFRKYNYGPKKNMKVYGQKDPPKYNLTACMVPMAFFVGTKDDIIIKEDIYEAMENNTNVVMVYEVQFNRFTHTDFVFARNASELVYEPTYKLFKDFDDGKFNKK